MSTFTVHYSHAAPFIRHQLCLAAHRFMNAPTKRDEAYARGEFYAFAWALKILMNAADYDPSAAAGIGDEQYLPTDAVDIVRDQLGAARAERLGITA